MADGGGEDQRARRGRGPTTLKFLDTLKPGQRLQVESWLNSPVGPNSTYLTTYISHVAKDGNKLPLTVSNWTHMPAVFVLNAMLEVKLEAKLKRPPTAQEIYDATHAKRKSPVSSSKKMKMIAEASGSREINTVCRNKREHLSISRCNSVPTSPVPLIQECVTEDDQDNMQAASDELEDGQDNMQAESDESFEDFGYVGEPIESAKMTSSSKSPTVDDISTSVSGRRSDEEFEFVDNFKIPKEYAVLYKKIFHKYGHMATKKVIKSNDTVLVAFVTSLLKIISKMETVRGADLSEVLLETWEGDIEDAENLGFNIKWLRKKFDEVKTNWKSSCGICKEVEIYEKELDATQVNYVDLLARKDELLRETSKVILEIRKAEAKISSIQEKLAPENNFLNEPILGKLLN
ncbi:hypothetical protein MKW92_004811 [Papaver armeniacum]|nr:hypothetical protein MKW92_004811 [Papaver armeniacum]